MTDRLAAHRWQAIGALLFGACVIGFSGVLVRLTGTGPAAAGFWRLAFALPLLAVMTRRASGPLGRPTPIAWLIGLLFALDLGFWHYGLKFTSVGAATVLSNLAPVVVTAFAWIFLKQRPRALFLLALAIAVAGAWIMGAGRGAGTPVLIGNPIVVPLSDRVFPSGFSAMLSKPRFASFTASPQSPRTAAVAICIASFHGAMIPP